MSEQGVKHDCEYDSDPRQNKELARSLKGKHVLIAGAGRGIGRATAEFFAHTDISSLNLVALEIVEVEETARLARIINPSITVKSAAFDVRDFDAVHAFVEGIVHEFGRIDVVFMNAGRPPQWLPLHESEPTIWWDTVTVSLQGSFNFARAAIPFMREASEGGRLIFTSSLGAHLTEGAGSYTIGKLGTTRLAEILHHENKDVGIKTFSIHPGVINTRFYSDFAHAVEGKLASDGSSYVSDKVPGDIKSAKNVVDFFKDKSFDTPQMPAGMVVVLASGRLDFLSGRVARYLANKEQILREDIYRVKLIGINQFLPEWKD
ncbi:unnamed protein product [Clonostachys rhizophaga]|uniref:NAD(P)-binding protein n=1 Tax=Clonostachys rhizophaga TaxID=160324 RepID=A0A9N9VFX1_9HYPO|nr:unnamed protein product [Clonostachys rhizophaga]